MEIVNFYVARHPYLYKERNAGTSSGGTQLVVLIIILHVSHYLV